MDAVKYLTERVRMCNSYEHCTDCVFEGGPCGVGVKKLEDAIEAVAIVEKWSEEHPIMTSEMSDNISRAMAIDAIDRAVTKEAAKWSLQELPSAEPPVLTCDGCKHVGTYDTDFPCSRCIRKEKDYYA